MGGGRAARDVSLGRLARRGRWQLRRALERDDRAVTLGVLDGDGHARFGELALDEDALRLLDDALELLGIAAGGVEPDDEDVVAAVVGDAGERDVLGLDLGADVGAVDLDGRLDGPQTTAEV